MDFLLWQVFVRLPSIIPDSSCFRNRDPPGRKKGSVCGNGAGREGRLRPSQGHGKNGIPAAKKQIPDSLRNPGLLFGAPSGTRTRDTLIKSQVLYQLS